ncbi:pyridoxamine 5'-phosphate oxidase family protein [Caldimonas brevitalea]|uniref:Pyridoxamine 5'-phosphate oxidase n=1 Tax=Caldimonas brevitalea TaxID=413882 RepID=A0A0G3BHU6_9BURK|nr:pyridoxamine 5'-phosphate oxidase family protein [Caldimonas brevitalea]AKJ27558.1 pyridoxamine 5'-phosphate oxidase [Caldimonas brevitalea]
MTALWHDTAHDLCDVEALRALYGLPNEASVKKEADHVHPLYRPFIEASPFAVLCTVGPDGPDASPRGDAPGFVEVADAHTLLLPDRRGNNRIDSLRNVVHDPRVSLLFLLPGHRETLRVLGRGRISTHPGLLARHAVQDKLPRSVLVVHVTKVFFQCGRAVMRSQLWEPDRQVVRESVPTPGQVLEVLSDASIDGAAYDAALPKRQRETLY